MLELVPMDQAQYERFLERAIPNYARDQVRAGSWPEADALRLSEWTFEALLPEGRATPAQYLCVLVDRAGGRQVGSLWYTIRNEGGHRFAYLYDLWINEDCRRRGYGAAAMAAFEERVAAPGIDRILLHVFAHNEAAQALYDKVGYAESGRFLRKHLA
jgi:ribosomal protein S18 acetylase RimI-like enzyme